MRTRRATKAAAAATAGATRAAAAFAVTPSPPRKRPKTPNGSGGRAATRRSMAFDADDGVREEMRKLVVSRVDGSDGVPGGRNGDVATETVGGWCLVDGLAHCAAASGGILLPLIREHGPPGFYLDHIKSVIASNSEGEISSDASKGDGCESFRSLCRIVSGQQLAGSAAKTIWRRLLEVVDATEEDTSNLTPHRILSIVDDGDVETDLRAPAGLSNAKCNCIIAIATSFKEGSLSDNFLLGGVVTDDEVRSKLLSIKGLGPWSVDMFLLFQCHKSDVLPLGDLAFRNGTANLWGVTGKARGAGLCPKKDGRAMREMHGPFAPYRSISSYYMYKCSAMKN